MAKDGIIIIKRKLRALNNAQKIIRMGLLANKNVKHNRSLILHYVEK